MTVPRLREIRKFQCTTDGKNRVKEEIDCDDHYFIILTKESYNKNSTNLLGVPLTSKVDKPFALKNGVSISEEDISGDLSLPKSTVVLCDRPCRIAKEDLNFKVAYSDSFVNQNKYKEIQQAIIAFIKTGNIHSKP